MKPLKPLPAQEEIFAGLVSGFCVSPSNAVFDKAVIQFANGKKTVTQGLKEGFGKMIYTPFQFFTSFKFRWMYIVYGLTYIANNLSDTHRYIPSVPVEIQNLLVTFLVNTSVGVMKDKAYAQHFGASQKRPFPYVSLGLFYTRDIITVASAFTLPPLLSQLIEKSFSFSERKSDTIAQLLCPLLVQMVVSPLHLLGLDIYNRQGESWQSRGRKIVQQYPKTTMMRMARFLPAYGFGGVINRQLRKTLRERH